jgi:aldehyde dehydrogenase (NAD+)
MQVDSTVLSTAGTPLREVFARQGATALRWRGSTASQRVAAILRLRDALLDQIDQVYEAAHQDVRKSAGEVDLGEILPVCLEANAVARHLARWMKPRPVGATWLTLGTRSQVQLQPRGRCLIIGPYNYPLNLTFSPLISALAAGNPVMLKPSELTPALSAVMARLIAQVFPEDEVAVFEGPAQVAQALQELPFDHVFFTGSTTVGRQVMAAAARHLASVTLELGGKSPSIVDASADLKLAARNVVWAKFANAGQTCIAPDHVYVHESVKDEWLACCRKELAQAYGDSLDAQEQTLTHMVNERHAARVAGLLEDARQRGAQLLWGGQQRGRFIEPTLLDQVPEDAQMMRREIFGPLLPVMAYRELDEVIARVNAGPKPLALYLYSRTPEHVQRILAQTSSGGVCINHALLQYLHSGLPFGGVNESGMGQARGYHGFRSFSHERAVLKARWAWSVRLFSPGPVPMALRRLARWAFRRL